MRKTLKELNLLDDFLFGTLLTYPELGEKFSRALLQTIFQREFGKLTVIPQKIYYGSDTDQHGARLDVYMEEEDAARVSSVYDVEPDQPHGRLNKETAPRRLRFYHALIDSQCLKSGESYLALKNVIVIMITSYDLFGRDRMVYTIQNRCVEEPDLPYDDGAKTIYLYTKGTRGNPSRVLQEFLHYIEETTWENAVNPTLHSIQQMVDVVKSDKEVSLGYMKIFEREEMLINMGREEERARTEQERLRADQEQFRADQEQIRADQEHLRAEQAEEKVRQLEALLKEKN